MKGKRKVVERSKPNSQDDEEADSNVDDERKARLNRWQRFNPFYTLMSIMSTEEGCEGVKTMLNGEG